MPSHPRIVLQCPEGYKPELEALVAEWIRAGVRYVGVVGPNASDIEDIIDDRCVGDGTTPHLMLTASHEPPETVEDAIEFAKLLSDEYGCSVKVIAL